MRNIVVPEPTTDGREIVLTRHTQPEKDLLLLLEQLKIALPEQAPPKIHTLQTISNPARLSCRPFDVDIAK